MTPPLRSRLAEGELRPGEVHAEWTPYRHRADGTATGVVVGLSHGATVPGYFTAPYDEQIRAVASAGFPVVVPGSSARAWGNADAIDAVDRAVAHVRDVLGCRPRVALLGLSMGALAVCGWARQHPDEVAALALVTPAVDLVDLSDAHGYRAEIEEAHRAAGGVEAALPAHDPCTYASELGSIPLAIWYAPDDPVIDARSVLRFAAAHGGRQELHVLDLAGHDPTAAPGPELAAYLAAHR